MASKTLNDCFKEYLANIAVSQNVKEKLEDVRIAVRAALTQGIGEKTEAEGQRRKPHFMTQGSARYKTQNAPCFPPQQQVDYDYGCYLPLSYHENEGRREPQDASERFFKMVGDILTPLAKRNGWKYEEHKKCCRLIIEDDIHFDIPLYSVPDEELKYIRDQRAAYESIGMFSRVDSSADEERDLEWDDLPTESVMLATNDGDGNYSWSDRNDPRLLNVYFEGKSDNNRAIYRILKGWRDFQWKKDGPSSIFLMSVAEKVNGGLPFSDDVENELMKVLAGIERLNLALNEDGDVVVENPADAEDSIKCSAANFNRLKLLASGFRGAIKMSCNQSLSCVSMVLRMTHLGDRFPEITDDYTQNFRQPPRTTRAG